jgi:hypothetical protein
MRPIRVTLNSATSSPPISLDHYLTPFNVGIGCSISPAASLTYTVEHTFDDVFSENFDPATATWFPNTGLTNKTASTDGNYAFPVVAIRLRVSIWGSGSVTMTAVQAGMPGR